MELAIKVLLVGYVLYAVLGAPMLATGARRGIQEGIDSGRRMAR